MASRVSVNINVNDDSAAGLARVRQSIDRINNDIRRAGGTASFNVRISGDAARREAEELRRRLTAELDGMDASIRLHVNDDELRRVRQREEAAGRNVLRRADADLRRGLADRNRTLVNSSARSGDDSGRAFGGRFSRAMRSALVGNGSGSISAIFKGAFTSPTAIAAIVTVVGAVLALLGAAIAGVVTLAFGGAFVALGAMLAAKSVPVKNAWKKAADEVKTAWHGAGDAMIPVIVHAIGLMQKLSDSFLPHFTEAMRHSQGPVNDFLDHFAQGLKDFGKRAFKPMMEGFQSLLLAFGPDWDGLMKGMGDSFGALGRTVRDHSGEISLAIRMILGLITTLVDIINFLARTWVGMLRVVTAGWGYLLIAIANVLDGVLTAARGIIGAMADAFGWVPGIGKKLKAARTALNGFGDDTVKKLREMGQSSVDWGKRMDAANKERTLKVQIAGWEQDLKKARQDLKDTLSVKAQKKIQMDIKQWSAQLDAAKKKLITTTKAPAKAQLKGTIADLEAKIKRAKQLLADQNRRKSTSAIKGDISDLQRKIARAKAEIASVHGKSVSITVSTNYVQHGGMGGRQISGKASGGVVGMASGGVRRASGMLGTLVGEAGPELVNLPPGSSVSSANTTRRMLDQAAGGGGGTITLVIDSTNNPADRAILKMLRGIVRVQGGDAQVVLGQRGI